MPATTLRVNGDALRTARASKALTQIELANAAGIHPITYCRIETGQQPPLPKTIRSIAKVLDVDPAEVILGWSD